MDMIRHNKKLIQNHVPIMIGQIIPGVLDYLPQFVRNHLPINDLPEQTFPLVGADRDEIATR